MSQASSGTGESSLLKAWTLAAQVAAREGELRTFVVEGSKRPVHATVSSEELRGLLVPLRSGEKPHIAKELRVGSSGAIRAERSQFRSGHEVADGLHIWCVDSNCNDAFTSFAGMLVERMNGGSIGEELQSCYQEFVRLVGTDSAPPTSVIGLVGELLALRDMIERDGNAINFWGGPRKERHDFRNIAIAIEVKTSRRSEAKTARVHISDWDQLEVPEGGKLFLHAVRLENVTGGGLSIASLILEIRGKLSADGLRVFDELIARHEPRVIASKEEFAELSRITLAVRPGFPRLTPNSVNETANLKGVSAVQFDLDLQQAERFTVAWSDALNSIIAGA